MSSPTHRSNRTGPWWWISSVVSWGLLLILSAIIIATIVVPIVAGAQRYTILTGSMRPTYEPGSLIVVKPVDETDLAVGDAITYQMKSGEPAVVTHRIITVSENTRGERTFITRGDANGSADENPVVPGQIRGRVWYSVPYLGHVNTWLTGSQRVVTLSVAIGALGLYAIYMVVSGTLDSRRKRKSDPDSPIIEEATENVSTH